ncbi:glucose-1-phosphate thymidylyltransferase [Carbonactinospora thermoautotrophica]|uniref:Glucose-1-phosphate thymidylyltransferase n=1 Tax=Carbonactinospora thermoautotrophica TaxID=1469144 RepID=A0A132N2E4_9ACTN|nr:glucose-1-phosphate thymidylyltransferase [Carbonactinospora thermoautotrophica]KWX04311.1 glucose-1-phosphate thymidylyltransferase [Carbonactinospora thermoautotrophica]KWX05224.1 glucose-1-phosphate thymidylyltransferase [Carbonactinospora thermoautotrophica]
MKALVLAGGSGTRLRPVTHTLAKQLVPVANQPVLFYGLRAIAATGITEVGIVVGDTASQVQRAVGDGSRFGLHVTYLRQRKPLGLAHAVLIARDYLGADDFVMYLGDNFVADGITDLMDRFRSDRPAAQLMVAKVADPSAFGVAELGDDGRVVRVEEKPRRPRSDLALVGVYAFTPLVHEAVAGLAPSGRGELEITDAIQRLITDGHRVGHTVISGFWRDTGTVTDLLEVNRVILESVEPSIAGTVTADCELTGRVAVQAGAAVRRSRIVGPVVVGPGSVIEDCDIGPYTSIAEDCWLADSEIENSIVLRGASLRGVRRVSASLIGREAEVTGAPGVDCQLVLGDHSAVCVSP